MTRKPQLSWVVASLGAFALGAACSSSKQGGDAAGGSGGGGAGGGMPLGASCDDEPDPHCAHPIDRLLVPRFRGAGLPLRDGGKLEICRRMAIDLVGRAPRPAELDACASQTPSQMADAFMALPEYVRTQRRAWGERISYDSYRMWHGNAVEIDEAAGRLYRDEIKYDAFVTEVAMHPGFYARHQGEDWSAWVVSAFLGRAARTDEQAALRPLTRGWSIRRFCDGAVRFNALKLGAPPEQADFICSLSFEWAWSPCSCQPGDGSPGCRTMVWDQTVDFGMDGCTGDYRDLWRLSTAHYPGGRKTTCVDGSSGCYDRDLQGQPLTPFPAASGTQRARFASLGAALAAGSELWEAAADRELRTHLGWWQYGFRRPDYDVPEVRTVLADELRRTGSIRAIQKLLVTSLLYTAPAEPPAGVAEPPLWAMGPTKLLAAESWLDAAGVATGETLGVCDYRSVSGTGFGFLFADQALVERVPSSIGSGLFSPQRYEQTARALGGCNADQARPVSSSVGITMAQAQAAGLVCAVGSGVLPAGFRAGDTSDGALDTAARHLYRRVLARDASDADVAALRADMRACLGAGRTTGCAGPEEAARWACTQLMDSAEFALY